MAVLIGVLGPSAYFKVLTTKHGLMASAGARAYNGGLGAEPQRGPWAEPLVRGSGGEAPLKLKAF